MTAKPYDPTLKTFVEIEPESWPVLFGYAKAPSEVIDADIATVSGAAEKVLRVAGDNASAADVGASKLRLCGVRRISCWDCAIRRPWRRNSSEE